MYRATSSGTQGTSNFCLFHTRNCAASPVLTASAICSPDAFSCATREKMRSPPARSTRTRMLGNFCSKALPTFSANWRSADVYQVSWPSFVAAAINAGVMLSAGGAAAPRGVAWTSGNAVAALRILRREKRRLMKKSASVCPPSELSSGHAVPSEDTETSPGGRALQRLDLHHARHGLDGTCDLRRDFEAARQFHFDFRAALKQEHDTYLTIAIGVRRSRSGL